MSRSHKHNLICTDNGNSKTMRTVANKHIKASLKFAEILPQHCEYKKLFCSYNICDYKFRCSERDTKIIRKNNSLRKSFYVK